MSKCIYDTKINGITRKHSFQVRGAEKLSEQMLLQPRGSKIILMALFNAQIYKRTADSRWVAAVKQRKLSDQTRVIKERLSFVNSAETASHSLGKDSTGGMI